MNLDVEGRACPVCKAYLFEDDDIVFCPVCGAPHHRDCYTSIGHCALEEYHGTENQYDKINSQVPVREEKAENHNASDNDANSCVCQSCGEEYNAKAMVCPNCGTPNAEKFGKQFRTFTIDLLGGVPADTDVGNGVTAEEAKRFVTANSQRYIPKFAAMAAGFKSSWNWLAFLFPAPWLLSRKLYSQGVFCVALTIAFKLLMLPLTVSLQYVDLTAAANYAQQSEIMMQELLKQSPMLIASFAVGVVAYLAMRIIVGAIGDRTYYKYVINSVKDIKCDSEDIDVAYEKRGGVSFWLMLLGYFAVGFLPEIIGNFIM